jgi:sterol desaturase/sphingolipid hydroxylase (fatty acid hydroxylase superfamily)
MAALSSLSPLAQLAVLWAAVLAVTGAGMALLVASFDWPPIARHRVREELPRKIDPAEHRRAFLLNSLLSTSMFLVATFGFFDVLLATGGVGAGRVILEVAGVLLVYDFLYYLLHRFVFHGWEAGARWHRFHHRIRSPRTKDSLYVHPMETFLGVATMIASVALVGLLGGPGGVHVVSFAIAFLVYSLLNLFVHSAIRLPWFPLNLLCALSRHHDAHHSSMRGGYYASITPIWDVLLGTARESARGD